MNKMSITDAAFVVLQKSATPLTSEEITVRVLQAGLWTTTGKTPAATMSAALYSDIKKHGENSRFVKSGKGSVFTIRESDAPTPVEQTENELQPNDSAAEKKVWGIHCVIEEESLFKNENVIAIGWHELGDLSPIPRTREGYKAFYAKTFPKSTKQSVATQAGQVFRFVCEAKVGDYVVFPSKADRKINIGEIKGDYFYNAKAKRFVQQRKVKWLKTLPRTSFSQGALYEAGSALTFFMLKNYTDEFLSSLDNDFKASAPDPFSEISMTAENVSQQTEDFILKELSKHLKGYPLENFVAGLLEAMGYPHPKISKHGGDRGTDIVAYKDELPPRIVVQVKSQDADIPERYLSQLRGTLREGDYGVFVCLSDFSGNAQKYIRENPRIKGINGHDLAALIMKYYDHLPETARAIIPLKKVYIPVPSANASPEDGE